MANKIGWCDKTVNAVVGCTHGCSYCYARGESHRNAHRQAGAWLKRNPLEAKEIINKLEDGTGPNLIYPPYKYLTDEQKAHIIHEYTPVWCESCHDFKPHAHLERLSQITPRQKPRKIFADSMWDWNCKHNEPEWMIEILEKIRQCPQHIVQVLSKKPKGYRIWNFPSNVWLGVTVESDRELWRVRELEAAVSDDHVRFVSYEPMKGPLDGLELHGMDWLIIGAESGSGAKKNAPPRKWIDDILGDFPGPVFIKDSVTSLYPDLDMKDFPEDTK